jgi:hypothetical protein
MSILNAYLVPKSVEQALYNSITPVNSFRLLLNKYYGIALPLLQDEHYFANSIFGNITNITQELHK